MNEALASLVLAAGVAGAPAPVPVAAPRGVPARAAAVTEVARAPLAALAAAQAGGAATRELGGAPLTLVLAFDEKGDSWYRLSQGAWSGAFSEAALTAGTSVPLPSGAASARLEKGRLTLTASSGATLTVTEHELIDALWASARRFTLGPVTYAALWSDGASTPAALDLLRRDAGGNYFVTYRSPKEMRSAVQWFMGADMVLYGMRFEGADLVFVSEPVPPASKKR